MPGDDLAVIIGLLEHRVRSGDHASHRTAVGAIDEREKAVEKQVARVHHVGLCKNDETVAVGMRARHMHDAHGFIVDMQVHVLRVGKRRQCRSTGRWRLHTEGADE